MVSHFFHFYFLLQSIFWSTIYSNKVLYHQVNNNMKYVTSRGKSRWESNPFGICEVMLIRHQEQICTETRICYNFASHAIYQVISLTFPHGTQNFLQRKLVLLRVCRGLTQITTLISYMYTYVCVPAVFTDDSFPNRPSSKFKAWAMSRLSKFRFLRFSADGITFGESSLASDSEAI